MELNGRVHEFSVAIRQLAERKGYLFVDLETAVSRDQELTHLTHNGLHLKEEMQSRIATEVASQLLSSENPKQPPAELLQAIRRIAKARIEEMSDGGSIMPAGLTSNMTREEVRDLIRFLVEQVKSQSPPASR